MLLTPPSSEETPHLAALQRAVEAGFQFRQLANADRTTVVAIYAERWCRYGVVENVTLQSMDQAVARRIRIEDYPRGDPLWQHVGTVAEVVHELLTLPAHGFPGAPTIARRAASSLWSPGGSR